MKRKVNFKQLIAIALFATSISLFDFENPNWNTNAKNYIGLAIAIGLVIWDKKR